MHQEGLQDRIELLLEDYRDLTGVYDKLASIEMIEAVGHEYLPTYFAKCSELLASDGMMALQAITIPDQRYETYRKSTDFIQKHIFPGGCLPSLGAISGQFAIVRTCVFLICRTWLPITLGRSASGIVDLKIERNESVLSVPTSGSYGVGSTTSVIRRPVLQSGRSACPRLC